MIFFGLSPEIAAAAREIREGWDEKTWADRLCSDEFADLPCYVPLPRPVISRWRSRVRSGGAWNESGAFGLWDIHDD